jgi:hypothetical protein
VVRGRQISSVGCDRHRGDARLRWRASEIETWIDAQPKTTFVKRPQSDPNGADCRSTYDDLPWRYAGAIELVARRHGGARCYPTEGSTMTKTEMTQEQMKTQLARALANLDLGLEKLPPTETSAAVQQIELAIAFIQTVFAALGGTAKEIERIRHAIDGDM